MSLKIWAYETAQNMSSFSDFEKILDAVKTAVSGITWPGLFLRQFRRYSPYCRRLWIRIAFLRKHAMTVLVTYTKLFLLIQTEADPTVSLNFETPQYKAMIDRMQKWYDKGLHL